MKRILVTSSDRNYLDIATLNPGVEVNFVPTIETYALELDEKAAAKIINYFNYDYIVFTSKNAVKYFFENVGNAKNRIKNVKIAATGVKTAEVVKKMAGTVPEILPEKFNAESLLEQFPDNLTGKKILIPGSKISRKVLKEGLSKKGAEVDFIPTYDTRTRRFKVENKEEFQILKRDFDAYVFTSPSSFVAYLELLEINNPQNFFYDKIIIPLGSVTENEIKKRGIEPYKPPEIYTITNAVEMALKILKQS